jgi:ubiquinone/menaquinone biosynthesis C-methylase UbiE
VERPVETEWRGGEDYESSCVPAMFGPLAERLLDAAALHAGERVLDLACGTGVVARAALRRGAAPVVGADRNGAMLAVARRTTPGATFVEADAAALPFADGVFDLATCQQGLQFFPDRTGALRELARVLGAGGRAAVALWGPIETHPCFATLARVVGRVLGADAERLVRAPYALADVGTVEVLARGAGFAEVRVEHHDGEFRWPSCDAFVRGFCSGSMLRPLYEQADAATADRLVAGVADELDVAEVGEPVASPQLCNLFLLRS